MCGIIGYTGSEDVKGVLLDALELLEYRGYDSAGIAVADTDAKQTKVYKCALVSLTPPCVAHLV